MSDHLNFIRIRGLTGDPEEVFQGLAGAASGSSSSGSVGGSTPTALEWGEIPEEAVEMLMKYTTDLNAWISQARETTRALKMSRGVEDLVPYVPVVIQTVATGGLNLPAVATVMGIQAIMNLVGSAVENYAASLDENSPSNILKKALLYEEDGNTKSILFKALLYAVQQDGKTVQNSVLNDRLSDLAYVDETVDFGFCRVHIKGKMIEY